MYLVVVVVVVVVVVGRGVVVVVAVVGSDIFRLSYRFGSRTSFRSFRL